MKLKYLTELKNNLKKDNHEQIAICLKKLFNEKEDTNIKGKEFQYLNDEILSKIDNKEKKKRRIK